MKNIDSFLNKRNSRIRYIETLVDIYQKIGNQFCSSKKTNVTNCDSYDSGCIYQFFAFLQKPIADMIFVTFITITGEYDKKKKRLKDWYDISVSKDDGKEEMINQLKEIRRRYKEARNKFICHIDDEAKNSVNISIDQIKKDIKVLKDVFNKIRFYNKLPQHLDTVLPSEDYAVLGLEKIFKILNT